MSLVGQLLAALTYYFTPYTELGGAPKLGVLSAEVGSTSSGSDLGAFLRPSTSPGNLEETSASSEQKPPPSGLLFPEENGTTEGAKRGRALSDRILPPTSSDMLDAVAAAAATRLSSTKEGDMVAGISGHTGSGYVVRAVFTPRVEGEDMKALVMSKGNTAIISFMMAVQKDYLNKDYLNSGGEVPMVPWQWDSNTQVMKVLVDALSTLNVLPYLRVTFGQNTKFIYTGHSMGGALAQLQALQVKHEAPALWNHAHSSIVSFGSPRVGDQQFVTLFGNLIPSRKNIRFVYKADVVPSWPPSFLRYEHAGTEIRASAAGYSSKKQKKLIICSQGGRRFCDDPLRKKIAHHAFSRYKGWLGKKLRARLDELYRNLLELKL